MNSALPSQSKVEQNGVIFLLQTGTFLEYFDLMLYVHMAVLLNELFFPKTSGFGASLLGAFAFCSTFVFRPFGALFLGYIGDRIGRKKTIVVTSMLMSFACITMGFLPTYESIGIAAAVGITLCRALQGISSMGEVTGAAIYLTETLPRPKRYSAVAWLEVSANLGGMLALGFASLVMLSGNWRPVFFFGASVAVIGSLARSTLRETPEFLKSKIQQALPVKKPTLRTLWAMFFIFCSGPVWFYFVYVYCSDILRDSFGYSSQDVIQSNFMVSVAFVVSNIVFASLSRRIYPLGIMKFFVIVTSLIVLGCPYLLGHATSPWQIVALQMLVGAFKLGIFPGEAIFYRHLPVSRRMTLASLGSALAKALMFIIVSFGLVYLTRWFGHWGLWLVMVPVVGGFAWAVKHFEVLDAPYKDTSDHVGMEVEEEVALAKAA